MIPINRRTMKPGYWEEGARQKKERMRRMQDTGTVEYLDELLKKF